MTVPPHLPAHGEPARASGVQLGELQARTLILEGAARTFAERGLRATSVADLLAAAGVARRTFYRLYGSKEDVAVALYHYGTEALLEACRHGVAQEHTPLRRLERCIDAHLANAREHGRLVFVLGGEAQRHESALHARRMEVHAALVDLMTTHADPCAPELADPLLYRGFVLAIEGVTRFMLAESDDGRAVTDAGIHRVRSVLLRMATGAFAEPTP